MVTEKTPELRGNAETTKQVKASLSRLAGSSETALIERGEKATADLEAAARFVESGGLDELKAAVAATEDPDLEARGKRTVEVFSRFQQATDGDLPAVENRFPHAEQRSEEDHFHHGRGTDLRGEGERPDR